MTDTEKVDKKSKKYLIVNKSLLKETLVKKINDTDKKDISRVVDEFIREKNKEFNELFNINENKIIFLKEVINEIQKEKVYSVTTAIIDSLLLTNQDYLLKNLTQVINGIEQEKIFRAFLAITNSLVDKYKYKDKDKDKDKDKEYLLVSLIKIIEENNNKNPTETDLAKIYYATTAIIASLIYNDFIKDTNGLEPILKILDKNPTNLINIKIREGIFTGVASNKKIKIEKFDPQNLINLAIETNKEDKKIAISLSYYLVRAFMKTENSDKSIELLLKNIKDNSKIKQEYKIEAVKLIAQEIKESGETDAKKQLALKKLIVPTIEIIKEIKTENTETYMSASNNIESIFKNIIGTNKNDFKENINDLLTEIVKNLDEEKSKTVIEYLKKAIPVGKQKQDKMKEKDFEILLKEVVAMQKLIDWLPGAIVNRKGKNEFMQPFEQFRKFFNELNINNLVKDEAKLTKFLIRVTGIIRTNNLYSTIATTIQNSTTIQNLINKLDLTKLLTEVIEGAQQEKVYYLTAAIIDNSSSLKKYNYDKSINLLTTIINKIDDKNKVYDATEIIFKKSLLPLINKKIPIKNLIKNITDKITDGDVNTKIVKVTAAIMYSAIQKITTVEELKEILENCSNNNNNKKVKSGIFRAVANNKETEITKFDLVKLIDLAMNDNKDQTDVYYYLAQAFMKTEKSAESIKLLLKKINENEKISLGEKAKIIDYIIEGIKKSREKENKKLTALEKSKEAIKEILKQVEAAEQKIDNIKIKVKKSLQLADTTGDKTVKSDSDNKPNTDTSANNNADAGANNNADEQYDIINNNTATRQKRGGGGETGTAQPKLETKQKTSNNTGQAAAVQVNLNDRGIQQQQIKIQGKAVVKQGNAVINQIINNKINTQTDRKTHLNLLENYISIEKFNEMKKDNKQSLFNLFSNLENKIKLKQAIENSQTYKNNQQNNPSNNLESIVEEKIKYSTFINKIYKKKEKDLKNIDSIGKKAKIFAYICDEALLKDDIKIIDEEIVIGTKSNNKKNYEAEYLELREIYFQEELNEIGKNGEDTSNTQNQQQSQKNDSSAPDLLFTNVQQYYRNLDKAITNAPTTIEEEGDTKRVLSFQGNNKLGNIGLNFVIPNSMTNSTLIQSMRNNLLATLMESIVNNNKAAGVELELTIDNKVITVNDQNIIELLSQEKPFNKILNERDLIKKQKTIQDLAKKLEQDSSILIKPLNKILDNCKLNITSEEKENLIKNIEAFVKQMKVKTAQQTI